MEDKRLILPVKLCQLYFFFSSRRCGKKWFSPNSYNFKILSAIDSGFGSQTNPHFSLGTKSGIRQHWLPALVFQNDRPGE